MAVTRQALANFQLGGLTRMPAKPELADTAREIENLTGYQFSQTERLQQALTHASAGGGVDGNYERLEFLGDRVLGLAVAKMLFDEFPEADEGELSRRFNQLVSAETCAAIADRIGLGDFMLTGAEIKSLKGRKRVNLRADVVESFIAAIYLDGGFEPARKFIETHWWPLAQASGADRRDAKTELQEWAHRNAGATPEYETEQRTGPDHDPTFTVKATVTNFAPAVGSGKSKREAEQAAATAILVREGVWKNETATR